MLRALPELVTQSLEEYETLALKLARDADLLRTYRDRLAANRLTCSLFDTDLFRRRMEAAYTRMLDIAVRGENPRALDIDAE